MGKVAINEGGVLAFDRSDTITVSNTMEGLGNLHQQGSGTLIFNSLSVLGGATIENGTLQMAGRLKLTERALTNQGTLRIAESGVLKDTSRRFAGNARAISAGEVYLASTGLGREGTTFTFEISTDGQTYYPIANGGVTDSQVLLSGLRANTTYYLRSRSVGPDGSLVIYDGGTVTTLDGPGSGVADTSGWYRVTSITRDGDGAALYSSSTSTGYVGSFSLPQSTGDVLLPRDPQVHLMGTPDGKQYGQQPSFNLDHSWVFAESPEGAILQSLVGLVTDNSTPTIVNGTAKLWYIHETYEYVTRYDVWTFDPSRYPVYGYDNVPFDEGTPPQGAYSEHSRSDVSYTINISRFDPTPPCDPTNPCECGAAGGGGAGGAGAGGGCGAPGKSGAAVMPMSAIDQNGAAAPCSSGAGGGGSMGGGGGVTYAAPGLTYSSRECSMDTGFGPGWSDADELPLLLGGSQNMVVRFGTEQTVWLDRQEDGSYAARYGLKDTLVHDAQRHLFILIRQDGSRCEFFDMDQTAHPQGGLYRWIQASGATIEVTAWTQPGISGRVATVLNKTTPTAQAYQKREFTYWNNSMETGRFGHVHTITLSEYDSARTDFVAVRKITYDYYRANESYGLPGDLKTIVTQQWDADATTPHWIGDNVGEPTPDTNYFRYYTSATTAHELERVLLPNAYAAFVSAYGDPADPSNPNAGDSQTDPISNYTCFYYGYNADRQVSHRVVFGKTNETSYAVTLSGNSRTFNNWNRRTIELRPDRSTYTVYTNHINQPILTDLRDASGNHTLSYNRYDDSGRLVLTVDSAAFVAQMNPLTSVLEFYSELLPDLVDFASGNSPYFSDTEGRFQETAYYASTTPGLDENTHDGGVEGYTWYTAVAEGEAAARGMPGAQSIPSLLTSYTYFAHAVGGVSIYPIASYTTYSNEDGTGAATTQYAYSWYTDNPATTDWNEAVQIQQRTVALPEISTDQNGSGTGGTTKQWANTQGKLTWSMDELHRVTYYEYDPLTGQLTKTIEDIDRVTADSLGLIAPPALTLTSSDWTSSGGANRPTDYQRDAFGRVIQILGPAHTIDLNGIPTLVRTATWTVYDDAHHQTRSASGYVVVATQAATIVGPISIAKTDRDGRVTEQIQATWSGTLAEFLAAEVTTAFPQTTYVSWTTSQYANTRLMSTRVYHAIPDSDAGEVGTNYLQTDYRYETFGTGKKGRQIKTIASDGTITRVVLDARGNVLENWIGTNDAGATDTDPSGAQTAGNNMVKTASYTYDADGNLTESRSYFGAGASDYYATEYQYDYRGRQTSVFAARQASALTAPRVVKQYEYDNLGRVLGTKTYASSDFLLDADELRSQTQSFYDNLGRVFETRTYEVDPDDGAVGDYLPRETWYDARGQVVKTATANGLFQKYAYDGLGQLVASYTCYDLDETAYTDADDVTGDTVIEATRYWYNQTGETIATATYSRLPDDTSTTGELTAANSYATASVVWYDGLGRQVATANYGREDTGSGLAHYFFYGTGGALMDTNANGIPDVAESARPQTFAESSSSQAGIDFQLQLTQYDTAGRAYRTIDNLGRINHTEYDDAGRAIRTIQNYQNGTVEETDTQQDITVAYQYDYRGRLATMTAYNAKGSGGGVQAQATKYLYDDSATAINHSWQTVVIYPDSTDELPPQPDSNGVWSITTNHGDHTSTQYDRLGRVTATTDQRGVVHAYTYDSAGRKSADLVTSLGATGIVDDSVLAIVTTYDDIGRVQSVTSYDSVTARQTSNVVNQVRYAYDNWGNLATEWQAHDGAVDTSSTPKVQYVYADGATDGVAKYVRLTDVVYPNGRDVQYGYGAPGAIDDIMSRLATISDSTGTLSAYKYLGRRTIVEENNAGAKLTYLNSSGNVTGLDRFGRVVDQVWKNSANEVLDEYTYACDRAGNRVSKLNAKNHDLDETYEYDVLDRLTEWSLDGVVQKTWSLDSLGNNLAAGTYNAANEETPTQGSSGYDAAGNMATLQSGKTAIYDAWNRMVEVEDGETVVERCEYDGTNRRIQIFSDFDGSTPDKVQDDYQSNQQVIESDVTTDGSRNGGSQTIWSPRFIDAPILRDTLDTAGTGIVTAERVFYLADANYNVTGLAKYDSGDGQWKVAERYSYTPYGVVTYHNTDWTVAASSANANTTLYTGRTLDALTGLQYNRARFYDAGLERFINRDPIGYEGDGMNVYCYVKDNPIRYYDPTGMQAGAGSISDAQLNYAFDQCWITCGSDSFGTSCKIAAQKGWNFFKGIFTHSVDISSAYLALMDKMNQIAQDANNFATQAIAELGVRNTERNHSALRHCYASAMYSRLLGIRCALCLGEAREDYQQKYEGQPPAVTRRVKRNCFASPRTGVFLC